MSNSVTQIQNSLNAGEISPSLWGHIDLDKWKSGSSTCRNFFVDYRGGVKSRAGLAYVGTCKQGYTVVPDVGLVIADATSISPPRDIPFQFNINQGYALEFGEHYMRVKSQGAYVTETEGPILNPNYAAIEGFVGADAAVGHSTNAHSFSEDRDVPYIIQVEEQPTTGDPGFKLMRNDTDGSQLAEATCASLGTSGVRSRAGQCIHPNGNFYCTEGLTNSAILDTIETSNLTLLGTFGTGGGTFGSDSTHFAASYQMIPSINNGINRLISVGSTSAFDINEISLWNLTSTSVIFNSKTTTTEPHASVCEAVRGTGDFYALGYVTYGGGLTTPFTLYSGSTDTVISLTSVASISPTDVDPTWTNISGVQGPGYDQKDGNLICFVETLDVVTNNQYLIKVDVGTGSILWTLPVTLLNTSQTNLNNAYMVGLLQIYDHVSNEVKSINLDDGSQTTTSWNAGISVPDTQWFDHSLGAIFLDSGYTASTGPIPTYLGTWLANNSDVIPTGRCMGMYSSLYLPGTSTESGITITNITQANPAVLTINSGDLPPYDIGDWIYIRDVQGMTNFNGLTWIIISNPSPGQYTVVDLFGNVIDSTNFPAYTSGGITERLFTLNTPYAAEDLPYLKYTQSADVMTLCCVNPLTSVEYPPYSLKRLGNANWTITQDSFEATIQPPVNLVVTAYSSNTPTTWYSYVVTSVSRDTGEESVASDQISVYNNDISIYQGSNQLSWDAVDGASSYNIYAAPASYAITAPVSSVFGYIGTALGSSYVDNNMTPDFTMVPPVHFDPFAIGSITDVVITGAGDGNYSQSTIDWSISSSTGTGFDGFPIVADGFLVGFAITNPGSGYVTGDTISFTDSGGGLARGNYAVVSQPADDDFLYLNSQGTEFRDPTHTIDQPAFQIYKGATIPITLQTLANFLTSRAVNNLSLGVATYTVDDSHLYIVYKTPGTAGNSYTLGSSPAGWTRSGTTLSGGGAIGTGASATLVVGPESGTYPSVPAYFQQRRVYAGSLSKPDTYWMSQPGLFSNMDTSIPVTDSDSIQGTPWSQQVNGIQFLVPMPGGLIGLTGKSAWQINGGGAAAITPSNQTAIAQAYNGCNNIVPPIPINYDILYVQAKGSIVRDLSYNFYTNIYTGTDLTILSNHLFQYNNLTQMAWCEEPYKLVWALRDDGTLLCLTYMKEQEVYAWSRHDTNGLFVSICSITEPPVDALYCITERFVQGQWRYYSERMNNRLWQNVEGAYCVDSGVSYPTPNEVPGLAYLLTYPTQPYFSDAETIIFPTGTLSASASTGIGVTFTVEGNPESVFSSDSVGNIIRIGGGKAVITGFSDGSTATGDIVETITRVVPDNNGSMPVPAVTGTWSISPPVTIIQNLNHLNGVQVAILADGSVVPNQTVTNNQIVLDQGASVVTIGFPYTCQLQTLYLEHPDQTGTAQTRRKNISAVGLRVEASRGLTLGADQPDASAQPNYATVSWTNMNEIKERNMFVNAGTAVPLYTGDYYKAITSSWAVTGQVAVQQSYPLPANILAIVTYFLTGDDKN